MAEQSARAAESLENLCATSRPKIVSKARQLLTDARIPPSVLDAEDLVQTALLKACHRGEEVRNPKAYVYEVIKKHVQNTVRQRERRQALDMQWATDSSRFDSPECEDFSDLVTNRLAVHQALGQLPPGQLTAVWATKAAGYTQAETADIMGVEPGTVARHVSRALSILCPFLAAACVALVTTLVAAAGRLLTAYHATPAAPAPGSSLLRDTVTGRNSLGIALIVVCVLLLSAAGTAAILHWRTPTRKRCAQCDGERNHRFLRRTEQHVLKQHTGKANVEEFMRCLACRNVRTYFVAKPFQSPFRLPRWAILLDSVVSAFVKVVVRAP